MELNLTHFEYRDCNDGSWKVCPIESVKWICMIPYSLGLPFWRVGPCIKISFKDEIMESVFGDLENKKEEYVRARICGENARIPMNCLEHGTLDDGNHYMYCYFAPTMFK